MVDNNTQPFFLFFFYLYLIIIIIIFFFFVSNGRRDLESGSRAKVNNLLIETS